jgi:hypothetical protein
MSQQLEQVYQDAREEAERFGRLLVAGYRGDEAALRQFLDEFGPHVSLSIPAAR